MKIKQLTQALAGTLLIAGSAQTMAAEILFAHVDGGSYVTDGNGIAGMLSSAGHNVTIRNLNSAVYSDYDDFDQIFVYDLSTGLNNSGIQNANYGGIADWYNDLTDQNLILDGRIISSYERWTNANSMSPEDAWIQNYAEQLDLRGGGLVLGTDHYSYQDGINTINNLIDVNPFTGFFGSYPTSQAIVDPNSPLYVPSLDPCRADASTSCINDNSTTGFVATGLQANGQVLTPVAYHGSNIDAWNFAAVSSTMGSITFGTCGGPGQPPCSVTSPSTVALLGLGLFGVVCTRRKLHQSN